MEIASEKTQKIHYDRTHFIQRTRSKWLDRCPAHRRICRQNEQMTPTAYLKMFRHSPDWGPAKLSKNRNYNPKKKIPRL
jgi:hypothetical protein